MNRHQAKELIALAAEIAEAEGEGVYDALMEAATQLESLDAYAADWDQAALVARQHHQLEPLRRETARIAPR